MRNKKRDAMVYGSIALLLGMLFLGWREMQDPDESVVQTSYEQRLLMQQQEQAKHRLGDVDVARPLPVQD